MPTVAETGAEIERLQARVKQAYLEIRKVSRPYEASIALLVGIPERRVWSLLCGAGIICHRREDSRGIYLDG